MILLILLITFGNIQMKSLIVPLPNDSFLMESINLLLADGKYREIILIEKDKSVYGSDSLPFFSMPNYIRANFPVKVMEFER